MTIGRALAWEIAALFASSLMWVVILFIIIPLWKGLFV